MLDVLVAVAWISSFVCVAVIGMHCRITIEGQKR